ncbi:hypothetical protein SAMN05428988_3143 [Chitinophaga sp. YR573]|uniref:hypothetical protein n=1 Tax=Chitinophaga sp. YR573 TaxID=1881040 RepID=UPI0008ABA630|nr:hypothetical protein [Chitinophaga sp. YR573]SEW20874.1 hypothetical protein SAMN05428988_3143 [Chitinophaga sp. YR573]
MKSRTKKNISILISVFVVASIILYLIYEPTVSVNYFGNADFNVLDSGRVDITPKQLIDKLFHALGGKQRIENVSTVYEIVTQKKGEKTLTTKKWICQGKYARYEYKGDSIDITEIYTPSAAIMIDEISAKVGDIDITDKNNLLYYGDYMYSATNLLLDFNSTNFRPMNMDKRGYYVYSTANDQHNYFWIDYKSFLITRSIRFDLEGFGHITDYSNFTVGYDGFSYPIKAITTVYEFKDGFPAKKLDDITQTVFTFNVPIPTSLFRISEEQRGIYYNLTKKDFPRL